jgi:hypothetical protein
MYTDVLGLVTCAWGNLIDSVPAALDAGPWIVRSTGAVATAAEVAAEWHAVKDGKIAAFHGPRPLYLPADGVIALAMRRLDSNENYLARRWANWASWPADGQLGAHSCAWAAGAGWRAPHFDLAVNNLNFTVCAGPSGDADKDPSKRGEAWLNDVGNAGLRPRNLANKVLFANAAEVVILGLARDVLCWPNAV